MLHEDDPGHMAAASWQMQQPGDSGGSSGAVSSRPLYFMARASRGHIGRQVCWPPSNPEYVEVPPGSETNQPEDLSDGPIAPPPNMTTQTQFPAGFKLRDQAPVQQTPPAMILSQPAFKITQPLKQKGENKWPPKDNGVVTQEQVREFTKPKGGKRDYSEFFAQNALPQTFNSYRAPPGTQHHGELDEEQTGLSEM
ncbi:unnamed protein product [Meganyctiphanes norvegica]|uniref:Uncharacterized protein n=1 Tax=Meganyctiphanes norvegica TaxID=48144 RepID=A0AAV2QYV4_MEGNR